MMGGLQEHIPMFSEIPHVMPTLENVKTFIIITKTWPEWPAAAYPLLPKSAKILIDLSHLSHFHAKKCDWRKGGATLCGAVFS